MRLAGPALVALACCGLAVGAGWLAGGPTWSGAPALAWLGALAVGVQWVAWVPSALARSERFYDLTGSLTYLGLIAVALVAAGSQGPIGARAGLLAALVVVWAVRLGTFLFRRVLRAGHDRRFDRLKTDPARFLVAWSLQGLWVLLTSLAALAAIVQPPTPLGAVEAAGLAVWAAGFGLEVVADRQKSAFRADAANAARWIDRGVWAWSRHPNYLGEIVLWTGVATVAAPALHGGALVGLVSPVFVALLLTRVSGVPLLEAQADARWGGDPAYEAYKRRTPVLVPWGRRSST